MLIYHPKNDIYNCIYRFITIAKLIESESFEFNRLRILDFFFMFPHLISDISFPRFKGVVELKKLSKNYSLPYEKLPDNKRLFSEISDYHIQAIQILSSKKILELNGDLISLGENFNASSIQGLLLENKYIKDSFFNKFVKLLKVIELSGENGLKKRSGLMEYRYDAV